MERLFFFRKRLEIICVVRQIIHTCAFPMQVTDEARIVSHILLKKLC